MTPFCALLTTPCTRKSHDVRQEPQSVWSIRDTLVALRRGAKDLRIGVVNVLRDSQQTHNDYLVR